MDEARPVAARRAVVEVELDLLEGEAGAERVDRHAHLAAEAGSEREAGRAGAGTDDPLAGERLPRCGARAEANELPPHPLGDAEASADPAPESRHREVGVALDERPERPAQIGVAEEEPSRGRGALAGRQSLALAQPLDPDHDGARGLGPACRPVLGAPVDDEDLGLGEVLPQGGHGLPDPVLLVARGDEDGQGVEVATHSRP